MNNAKTLVPKIDERQIDEPLAELVTGMSRLDYLKQVQEVNPGFVIYAAGASQAFVEEGGSPREQEAFAMGAMIAYAIIDTQLKLNAGKPISTIIREMSNGKSRL